LSVLPLCYRVPLVHPRHHILGIELDNGYPQLLEGGGVVSLTRVFPVEIQAVKVVLLQELDNTVDKLLPLSRVLGHGRVLGRALVPAADSHGHLQLWVGVLLQPVL